MPRSYRLQELTTVTVAAPLPAQPVDQAIDVMEFRTLTVQVRCPVGASGVTLTLQHAPTRESDAFENVTGGSVSLAAAGNFTVTLTATHRYLRWAITAGASGSPKFLIDVLGRET